MGQIQIVRHPMVCNSGLTLDEVEAALPATSHYELGELISGTEGSDGEEKASNWISNLLTDGEKVKLHAEPKIAMPKLQGFSSTTHLRPGVVLLTTVAGFPIMTVEVVSKTTKK